MSWGHSSLTHTLQFARRVAARKTLLFHHDPRHTDDDLDAMFEQARAQWTAAGGEESAIAMAAAGIRLTVGSGAPAMKS